MEKCVACGEGLRHYLDCRQYSLLQCENCGLSILENPKSKERSLDDYKQFYDKKESERFNFLIETMLKFSKLLRLMDVNRFAEKKGKILDVGFGRPIDLEIFRNSGWDAYGITIIPHVVEIAKKKNLNAVLGEFDKARYQQDFFDVITFWHVLEHLYNPEAYIKKSSQILKKNGKLIIEVPNNGSLIARIFKCNWFELDLPNHIHHFTKKSLKRILNRNGFTIKKVSFFSLEQSPFSLLQSTMNAITKKHNVLFESLKKSRKKQILSYVLALILIIPAAIISILAAIMKQGDVMRVYAVKK